jgi:hypothetical protein
MPPKGLETQIDRIKQELRSIGPMRPGSLSQQYSVCGKPGCRCVDPSRPRKHGPYYQLSYVHRGKSTTQFVRPAFLSEVKAQLANYKRFRRLVDQWVHVSLELSRGRLEELKRSGSD